MTNGTTERLRINVSPTRTQPSGLPTQIPYPPEIAEVRVSGQISNTWESVMVQINYAEAWPIFKFQPAEATLSNLNLQSSAGRLPLAPGFAITPQYDKRISPQQSSLGGGAISGRDHGPGHAQEEGWSPRERPSNFSCG